MSKARGGKMTQALYTSCTGLKAGTNQINVVSNNVANMNTTAYKSSRVNFETLFYRDMTPSSTASITSGGVNAKQIGYGVQIGGIARNFEQGTWKETGVTSDMMISGNGYFVCQDSEGRTFLTRDGSFSLDSNGDLVTASGYYVMGSESTFSTSASTKNVHIPQLLNLKVEGTENDENGLFGETLVSELNNASLTAGAFNIVINGDDGEVGTATISFTQEQIDTMDINTMVTSINAQLAATDIGAAGKGSDYAKAVVDNGTIIFQAIETDDADDVFTALEFETPQEGGCNFVDEFGLSNVAKDADGNYVSKIVNYSAQVSPLSSYNDAIFLEEWSISTSGVVQATYSDGTNLTVVVDENNEITWQITTGDFIKMHGDDVDISETVLEKSNMLLELCTVVNEAGLESRSNNLWEIGQNAGTAYFGMAGNSGLGTIQSGGLESSNVELATELSEMIMAQRLVQANSRVFSTADSTMETLVYLGQ